MSDYTITVSGDKNNTDLILGSDNGTINSNETDNKSLEKTTLYVFSDNLNWSKSGRFTLGPFSSPTTFGPYSTPLLSDILSEYLCGEPINPFYSLSPINTGASIMPNISIGPKVYNNNNFTIAPAGGYSLNYKGMIDKNIDTLTSVGVTTFGGGMKDGYSLFKYLEDFENSGKKFNSSDYIYVQAIFMDMVALGALFYTTDKFILNGVLIDDLLNEYNITISGSIEEKYQRAISLIAEEQIRFVNLLKSKGAKNIILCLYNQENLHKMPVISNAGSPEGTSPWGIAGLPGKIPIFDKQSELFDNAIREAFSNDPNVCLYDMSINKIIDQNILSDDGQSIFINTDVDIALNMDIMPVTMPHPYRSVVPIVKDINEHLENGGPLFIIGGVDSSGNPLIVNKGTPPAGSNVYNSVWYTGEHFTPQFNLHLGLDIVDVATKYFV